MRLNWLGYTYLDAVGYGKYSSRMVHALRKAGVTVRPELAPAVYHPDWLLAERGLTWDCLTVSCMPPYHALKPPQGPHWLLTMTEGGELPDEWAEMIRKAGVDRVIVPCEHNARVFREGGVECPISVIPGGTSPEEFRLWTAPRPNRPYTFLCLADRGNRKGWNEVCAAFYTAFGGITTGVQDVRLIIKCRPDGNALIEEIVARGLALDPRVRYLIDDADNLWWLFAEVDCFVCPSRSEGWGMPHREAAMMGLPVITQAFAGLDDGHTHEWALVVEGGQMAPIDDEGKHIKGEWRIVDIPELAGKMRAVYDEPWTARTHGFSARTWLASNQTWDIAAANLINLMRQEGLYERERLEAEHAQAQAALARHNQEYLAHTHKMDELMQRTAYP